jgi:hypothetical protein
MIQCDPPLHNSGLEEHNTQLILRVLSYVLAWPHISHAMKEAIRSDLCYIL